MVNKWLTIHTLKRPMITTINKTITTMTRWPSLTQICTKTLERLMRTCNNNTWEMKVMFIISRMT